MNVRPILFQGEMIRALLEGRKTQTRRIVKPSIVEYIEIAAGRADDEPPTTDDLGLRYCQPVDDDGKQDEPQWCIYSAECPEEGVIPIGQGYGARGDLLWVRESCFREPHPSELGVTEKDIPRTWATACEKANTFLYRADAGSEIAIDGRRWTPSIHMPRHASRLTLELIGVGIERVQDITEVDAQAEGVTQRAYPTPDGWIADDNALFSGGFAALWESINGKESWDANPWVWALTFNVHEMNIDEYLRKQA